jgi:nicotinamidase-related amidase
MKLPATGRRKALIVIDVQPAFIRPHNEYIIDNIVSLIEKAPYDLYIEAVFHAEKDSLWDDQQKWICPENEDTHTVEKIADALAEHSPVKVLKETRSVFKGQPSILSILKDNDIGELHLVGTETNDCVFATALDSFDNGFPVYILEECCQSASEGRHEPAVQLLRHQGMTNNRCLAKTIELAL